MIAHDSPIPPRYQDLATRLGASFGINADATTLMMLQAVGFAFGNTVQIATPELRELGPAFNTGLITSGAALPRGVLMALGDPIAEILRTFTEYRDARGLAAIRLEFENTVTKRGDLLKIISENEKKLAGLKAERPNCAEDLPRAFAAMRANTAMHQEAIEQANKAIVDNDKARDSLLLTMGPRILKDEPPWRSLDSLATEAFDSTVLATRFENGAGGMGNLTGKQLEACMETLLRARLDATGVNMIISDREEAYAQALSTRRILESGVFQNFVFVEAGSKSPGPFPLPDFGEGMNEWTDFILEAFTLRVEGHKRQFKVDGEGYKRLMDFRIWCLEQLQDSTTDMCPFFMWWPDLCLRLALSRHAMDGREADCVVPAKYVDAAAEFLMRLARRQFTLLERMMHGSPEEEKWARVEQIVGKLQVRGPMTRRSIVRCFNNQDYRTIEALIAMGIAEGRIEQRGALFVSKSVSVSASAA